MFFESTSVTIGAIKLNNADHLANVAAGSNYMVNRNVKAKKTQGFGQQFADSVLRFDTIQMVLDADIMDTASSKTDGHRKFQTEGCS
ncbi:hypothetical protein [Paenibacillus elgii]|uniref:hypothetical protein n=1 Tax=Paenibacillus elgii TaxID=189691 RepID=UPI0013D2A789|nr:hypothetical protein [Paenibacillus elgii]